MEIKYNISFLVKIKRASHWSIQYYSEGKIKRLPNDWDHQRILINQTLGI